MFRTDCGAVTWCGRLAKLQRVAAEAAGNSGGERAARKAAHIWLLHPMVMWYYQPMAKAPQRAATLRIRQKVVLRSGAIVELVAWQ